MCLAAACGGSGTPSAPGSPSAAGHPCTGAEPPARFAHVILIVMENHGFDQVAGHSPFLNALAHRCGLAADYHAVAHPSLPNYLALTSGIDPGPGRTGLLAGQRLPERRGEHLQPDPLAGVRREHDRPLRPHQLRRLRPPPQSGRLLHAREGRVRDGRRPPHRASRRPAQRPPRALHVHRAEPVQRRAQLRRLRRRCVAGAVDAAADLLGGLPARHDRHLHHLRRGRPRRGQPRLHRRGRAGRCARAPCPRRRSRTTRCCARTSSCWACRRSARRRPPHRWRRPSTSPADASARPGCANDPVLPCRPDGEDTDHRREAVRRTGLRAGARRRLRKARGLPRVGRERSSRGRSGIWSSWPSRRTTTRRSSGGRSRPCRCSRRRSSCGPTPATASSST